ncbi:P-loop containing nucleoside triphosphate hydrolase protein, partial [Atractiella rhizophila]
PINEDTNAPRMLTKSEKEKAKKERDKARKKAQAAAKKATGAKLDDDVPQGEPSAQPEHAKAEEENQGEEEAEAEGTEGGDKKKKKKKKGAAKKEEDVTPSSTAKGGKQNAKISALRALVEQQQKARAEQLAKEEEERSRRIEEEERRREEEERQREEAKLRKKEREKSKREELRKAGKLLTPKQKAEERARQQRLEALKASGVVIEGLQAASDQKKPVYGKKRINKKAQKDEGNEAEPSARDVAPESAQVEKADGDEGTIQDSRKAESEVKDSWDAPSEDEGVKDTWDASSASEEEGVSVCCTNQSYPKILDFRSSDRASHIKPTGDNVTESESGSDTDEESSEDDESSEVDSEEEKLTATQRQLLKRKEEAAARRAKQHEEALAARSKDNLRSPICCILGHVDTGKTKLLDKIRQTNVQEGEAGGITQQIGATYFPIENIRAKTSVLKNDTTNYNLPGLLVIDTPGHESFTNLRSRGSSLCNIAILVVDIMHGLEPQTLESIRLLKDRKTPFVVALNKIDRLYGWEPTPDGGFQDSLAKQKPSVQRLFEDGLNKAKLAFAEQGLNAVAYYENNNFSRNVSLVPTSAISGEGIPDLLMLLCKLTTERMSDRLMYLSELECTVLEVKVVEGLGTTIDVVLSNGVLHVGDRIVLCGLTGAIATNIRQLLTPQPLKELRVKGQYVHHQSIKAAMGIKIGAPDLENAIAGSRLLVVGKDDDEDDLKDEVMADLAKLLNSIDRSKNGVCVQSSTLGS